MKRFEPGDTVAWRSVWRAERVVGTAWPWTVVTDEDGLIALYRPSGTRGRQRSGEFGGPRGRMLVRWDGGYRDLDWHGVDVLTVHRPGDMYSVWRAWNDRTGELAWRYVNLEEVWARTAIGFDSKDLYLDLWSEPSGPWQWKDEDEIAWAVAEGRLTPELAAAVRKEAELAMERMQLREPPHDRDWDSWRPDPAWSVPVLPDRWRDYEPGPSIGLIDRSTP
jgi:uncharacterized protein DUF402